ncbi:MAG: hypothetical protein IEMM0003_0191 [bacterium]|nr:MAG: hypothetical protein IEMM0003_0191 [bacterium]
MPGSAGVYIMKDRANQILYVGKAKNLRKRVGSYFQDGKPSIKLDPIKQHMIKNVAGIETLNTKTELDALIWEDRLIKEIQPKYNIKQKDDSSYPYLVLTMHDEFPKLLIRRLPHKRLSNDMPEGFREISGDLYYGPLTPAKKLYSILKILRKLYKLIPRESNCFAEKRACIYYDINICPAPCVGFIDNISYRKQTDSLRRFLDGGSKLAMKVISDKMRFASQHLQYEDALFWKETARDIDRFFINENDHRSYAAIDISSISGKFCVAGIVFYKNGKFIKSEYRKIGLCSVSDIDAMNEAVKKYFVLIKDKRSQLPEFFIIDGGDCHISGIKKIKESLDIKTTLIAISKEHQIQTGFSGLKVSKVIRRKSGANDNIFYENREKIEKFNRLELYQLVQRLRDEAHRFAVSYHRKKRKQESFLSILDDIDGIGKKRKGMLLAKFGSLERIKAASADELCSIKGITPRMTERIAKALNNTNIGG